MVALPGCGGGSGTPLVPEQYQVCSVFLPAPPPTLLYPEQGAVGLPDGNFALLVEDAGSVYSIGIEVAGSTAPQPLSPTAVPSPLPTPAATPAPGVTPAAFGVPALMTNTQYVVTGTIDVASSCGPTTTLGIGSFTTR
jgi:hypothetical protein